MSMSFAASSHVISEAQLDDGGKHAIAEESEVTKPQTVQSTLEHVSGAQGTKPQEDRSTHTAQNPDVRRRTPTVRGLQFQTDCAKQSYSSECKKIRRQYALVNELLQAGNVNMLRQEIANLDKRLSDAEVVHSKLISMLPEESHAEQQDKHDKVDQLVFEVKKKSCTFLKENEGSSIVSRSVSVRSQQSRIHAGSRDSIRSHRSRTSNISKVESLKVEEEALEEAQRAKTEELECFMKLEKAKMESQRTRLHQKIVKAKIEEGSHQAEQLSKRISKGSPVPQVETGLRSNSHDLTEVMIKLTDLHIAHSAPNVDIDIFSGNPLDYGYFRATFHEVVEKKILEPRGRLTRLLKYTEGEAKELIKHCIYEKEDQGFDQAMELLDREFGNCQIIINAYLKKLRQWPNIKSNDAKGYKKFHRFLGSGLTHRKGGRLKELDSENVIRTCIMAKLDRAVQDKWLNRVVRARERSNQELDFCDVVDFVGHITRLASDPSYSQGAYQEDANKAKSFSAQCQVRMAKCPLCDAPHRLEDCEEFGQMSLHERARLAFHNYLCFSCLEPSSTEHVSKSCPKKISCDICNENHVTVMHGYRPKTTKSFAVGSQKSVSMCIVPVRVATRNSQDRFIETYALLDENCQSTFVHASLVDKLSAEKRRAFVTTSTINGTKTEPCFAVEGLIVKPSHDFDKLYPGVKVHLPAVYTREDLRCDKDEVPTPDRIREYDNLKAIMEKLPEFDQSMSLGLIIGANCPRVLEPQEVIPGTEASPYASRSILGWRVIGPISGTSSNTSKCFRVGVKIPVVDSISTALADHHFTSSEPVKDAFISQGLQRLYNVDFPEDRAEEVTLSVEDNRFLELMNKEIVKIDGHYQLPLPFRDPDIVVPNNRPQAISRLTSTRRKMLRDEAYRTDYCGFMATLIGKGYAIQSDVTPPGKTWYIYHFGVREPKKKNKLRVVFDCSASFRGFCLNEELLQGPDLTNHLLGVLLRFRIGNIGFVADIEAMFHQVRVPPKHQTFLKFLWWPEGDTREQPVTYQMCVHLFGAISSPSCANFALHQAVGDNRSGDPIVYDVINSNFYVDDMLRSEDTPEVAIQTIASVTGACERAGFNLTKFVCKEPLVIASIPTERRSSDMVHELSKAEHIERALGVHWCLNSDSFGFRITLQDSPLTRRGILSTISSIYDPFGFAGPFLLRGRKILQKITSLKGGWDSRVPEELVALWTNWRQGLPRLQELSIPRCYRPKDFGPLEHESLHIFSDASEVGYGVVSYLRQVDVNGRINVSMVFGKSRVTPSKPITIPRLELTAAAVSVRIGSMLKDELHLNKLNDYYWTDSKISLGYICNDTRRFRIFVANRAAKIRCYTSKEQWQYVETSENPADHASRGLDMDDKEAMHHWFNGPHFLWQPGTDKNKQSFVVSEDDPEIRRSTSVLASKVNDTDHMIAFLEERTSSWTKMIRVVSYICRFIANCRLKTNRAQAQISTDEFQLATQALLRRTQNKYFSKEISICRSTDDSTSRRERKNTPFWRLDPFIDDDGLMKVGGRLERSGMSNLVIHPVILPKDSVVSRRLVEHFHERVHHSGRTTTSNEVRQNGYWIINGNTIVRSVIHHCVTCRVLRGKLGEQKMAQLPGERFSTEGPFTYTGLDMFGPFYIKDGRKEHKRFVALFTCLSSRAVHLESTVSMDTDSFIQALRRFVARRGPIREILSDNGTNFVGAENELKKAFRSMGKEKINEFLLEHSCDLIDWKRRPPTASHFGGVWERQIRTVRNVLSAMLRSHADRLNDESFRTFLAEAECIVNSRPLTVDNLNDPMSLPLSPMNILTGKTKIVLPPPGVFQKADVYCRRRWRQVQHLANEFWSRWRKEFINSLQPRQKWNHRRRNFQINDVVMIKDENLPRNQWPLARITKVYEDPKDSLVRKVDLYAPTSKSVLLRPIQKLILLVEGDQL